MTTPPTGTVTFLFTDIEGSTTRWEHHREAMRSALSRHNDILQTAIDAHGGYVFKTIGDAFCAAFADPASALAAALDAQRAFATENWARFSPDFPFLRVRMALHTGPAEHRDGDYLGPPLNRTARLVATAHGGQVFLSLATQQLVRDHLPEGATLVDLGEHRLKDLKHTEHLFRLIAPGFPDIPAPPDTAESLSVGVRRHADMDTLPSVCPYRGLSAFREADAPYFFGRESFTELLIEAVGAAPMVGVIGPSGSGKSSVVFAGLVPRLRAGQTNGGWQVIELRPGSRPFHALAGALLPFYEHRDLTETDHLAETNKLARYLQDGTVSTRDVLARIGDKHPDLGRLLLVTDQFEELYTLCPDDRAQQAFQDLLFSAAFGGNGGTSLTLALTLRADFMAHALAYRPFADAMQHHNVILGPMTREELTRVVRLPAEKQGRMFETGLVERIVDDVGEKAGSLPLLEFALTKLWDLQESGWLTHDAYEHIGRVEGAVARHADTVYAGLGRDEQQHSRRVFVQLVQPGEGTEDTRRLATREDLGEDWPLVRRLADARLVTTGRDGAGHETAEVVHEALIRSWGQLREWMNADRTFRTWQERLRFALRQWEATGHDEGAYLRGAPLAEAEGWLTERGGELGMAERDFVMAGVEQRDQDEAEREAARRRELQAAERLAEVERQRAEAESKRAEEQTAAARKLRQRAVFLAVALIAAGGLAIAALVFGQQAQQNARLAQAATTLATARELAAASENQVRSDPELSALLALRAISSSVEATGAVIPEVELALHRSLQHTRLLRTIDTHSGNVADIAVSPDGKRILSGGPDGIKLWDASTGELMLHISSPITSVNGVDFSPRGDVFASGGPDGSAWLWDAASGKPVFHLVGHAGAVTRVAFSPDGALLATAGMDSLIKLWDVSGGSEKSVFSGHKSGVESVAWSPSGDRLASTSGAPTGSVDRSCRVWNVSSGENILIIPSPSFFRSVAFSRDGKQLATAGNDVRVWDAHTGQLQSQLIGHDDQVNEVIYLPDGLRLLTASPDKTAGIWWAIPSKTPLLYRLAGHRGAVRNVAAMPGSDSVVSSGGDGTIRIWDIAPGLAWRQLTASPLGGGVHVDFSPDGLRLATSDSRDQRIRIWDIASSSAVITFTSGLTNNIAIAFSPDGRRLATTRSDSVAQLWDVQSGALLRTFAGHADTLRSVAFRPDGTRLVTTSKDRTAAVWDVETGRRLLVFRGHSDDVSTAAYSPDGKQIATAGEEEIIKIWDADNGQENMSLKGHSGSIYRVLFSPDGTHLVSASDEDRTARMWDLAAKREVFSVTDHRAPIQGVAFSPDGSRFATSSWDGTVRVWSARTGEAQLTVAETGTILNDLKFSPDGTRIAIVSFPFAYVYVFTLRLDELISMAHEKIHRTLTDEECRVFLHRDACPSTP